MLRRWTSNIKMNAYKKFMKDVNQLKWNSNEKRWVLSEDLNVAVLEDLICNCNLFQRMRPEEARSRSGNMKNHLAGRPQHDYGLDGADTVVPIHGKLFKILKSVLKWTEIQWSDANTGVKGSCFLVPVKTIWHQAPPTNRRLVHIDV